MRTKDERKRIAIRDATINEVVIGGLAGASIARIADRAGLSQGTIYLYYATKEALFRETYVEIKLDMRDALMSCYNEDATSADNIRSLWFALLNYALDHPSFFAFTEYVTAAHVFDELDEPALAEVEKEMKSIITSAIDDGTLISVPYESLQAILVAPINHIARKSAIAEVNVSRNAINATFDLIWKAIASR